MTSVDQEMYYRHFIRINFTSNMAYDIAAFGESQGMEKLTERLDLTCGAIPSGEYNMVIDPSAPKQFLELYTGIAEYRLAFAVTELLKLNPGYIKPLENYFHDKGKALKADNYPTVKAAFELINFCVLDGMPDIETKQITIDESDKLSWKKLMETHENYWNKAGSSVEVYYQLQNCFINGLLDGSNITFTNQDNQTFTLSK